MAVDAPADTGMVPGRLRRFVVDTLKAVGSTVPCARAGSAPTEEDWRDVPIDVMLEGLWDEAFLQRQQAHCDKLEALHREGLSLAHILTLLRVWTAGACVHLQRANHMQKAWGAQTDALPKQLYVLETCESVRAQCYMRAKEG